MSDELFTIPVSESPRLRWLARVKADFKIFTHFCKSSKWMAFSQSKAVELLKEYDLTQEEKLSPVLLFAGYCRLLDESGLLVDGVETEEEAVIKVATFHGEKLWNEEP